MLQNNLDPEVAERPDDLVVYGGTGRAARDWRSFDAIVRTLTTLADDETMLVQSGRPVGRAAHARVGAAGADRQLQPGRRLGDLAGVPPAGAARPDDVRPDDRRLVDLHRHAGDPAGHLRDVRRGRRQAVRRHARRHAHAHRRLRRHGRRPAAGGHAQRRRLPGRRRRPRPGCSGGSSTRYLDEVADDLDDAVARCLAAKRERRPLSVGLVGNCATVVPELLRRGVEVDIVTDQTSAHDPLAYLPEGIDLGDWHDYADAKPEEFTDRARASMARHVEAMVGFQDAGAEVFDYGNSIRDEARQGGYERAFAFPGFVPAYIRPLFCEGKGPFRWAALSGDPADIAATDRAVLDLFPDNDHLHRWIRAAQERVAFQGLPARICWLGYGERDRAGLRFNELVASGEICAPIVIGRDHLDTGSVASPVPRDRGDGRRLRRDRRLAAAQRAGQHGVGRDAGCRSTTAAASASAGRSTPGRSPSPTAPTLAAAKLERVLTNDPGTGVIRHVDAGYDLAEQVAEERGVRVPMQEA